MILLEEALQKFEDLDPEVVFIVNSDRFSRPLAALSEKYGPGLSSAVILCLVNELPVESIANYLANEYEMPASQAKSAAGELSTKILQPLMQRLLFLNSDPDKEGITEQQEKEILRQMFAENILSELQEHFLVKNAVNLRIFDLLEKDFNFKRELERLLYENNELISKKNITVKNKNVSPTIANWLKDFIDKNGTGDFTVVTSSSYLTNTANTANLSVADRKQLADLLSLYHNLKFFPDTVKGQPIEEWRIIPFDMSEIKLTDQTAQKTDQANTPEPKPEDKLAQYDWSTIVGLERRALLEELGVSQKELVKWLGRNN
jgi:hypothetical protein